MTSRVAAPTPHRCLSHMRSPVYSWSVTVTTSSACRTCVSPPRLRPARRRPCLAQSRHLRADEREPHSEWTCLQTSGGDSSTANWSCSFPTDSPEAPAHGTKGTVLRLAFRPRARPCHPPSPISPHPQPSHPHVGVQRLDPLGLQTPGPARASAQLVSVGRDFPCGAGGAGGGVLWATLGGVMLRHRARRAARGEPRATRACVPMATLRLPPGHLLCPESACASSDRSGSLLAYSPSQAREFLPLSIDRTPLTPSWSSFSRSILPLCPTPCSQENSSQLSLDPRCPAE